MLTKHKKLNSFMKERLSELIHCFDEAIRDYSINSDHCDYANRICRILDLIQSYARIFDVSEMEHCSKMLTDSFAVLYREGAICTGDVVDLSLEARSCLFDMTELATTEGIDSMSLFAQRASAVASAIRKLQTVYHATVAAGPMENMRLLVT